MEHLSTEKYSKLTLAQKNFTNIVFFLNRGRYAPSQKCTVQDSNWTVCESRRFKYQRLSVQLVLWSIYRERPFLIEWPFTMTHDNLYSVKLPSSNVPGCQAWRSTLIQMTIQFWTAFHFNPFGPSTLDLTRFYFETQILPNNKPYSKWCNLDCVMEWLSDKGAIEIFFNSPSN